MMDVNVMSTLPQAFYPWNTQLPTYLPTYLHALIAGEKGPPNILRPNPMNSPTNASDCLARRPLTNISHRTACTAPHRTASKSVVYEQEQVEDRLKLRRGPIYCTYSLARCSGEERARARFVSLLLRRFEKFGSGRASFGSGRVVSSRLGWT